MADEIDCGCGGEGCPSCSNTGAEPQPCNGCGEDDHREGACEEPDRPAMVLSYDERFDDSDVDFADLDGVRW